MSRSRIITGYIFGFFHTIFNEECLIFAMIHLYYNKPCLCSESISLEQRQDKIYFEEKTGHDRSGHEMSLADAERR